MVSAKEIILEYVCPFFGVVLANLMFSAAFRDVQKAVTRGTLGDLNPTPWAFMLGNCAGWVAYSYLIQNYWVFFGNSPGFLLSIWLNLSAAKLQYSAHRETHLRSSIMQAFVNKKEETVDNESGRLDLEPSAAMESGMVGAIEDPLAEQARPNDAGVEDTVKDEKAEHGGHLLQVIWDVAAQKIHAPAPHERITVGIATVWVALISIVSFADFSDTVNQFIVGISVNLNLLFFYGAPLSTIFIVLSTRNSATIHIRTMLTNTGNGTFWAAYGLALGDPFIYVPNGLGAGLGVVQIVLCFLFPRIPSVAPAEPDEELHGFPEKSDDFVASKVDVANGHDDYQPANEEMVEPVDEVTDR